MPKERNPAPLSHTRAVNWILLLLVVAGLVVLLRFLPLENARDHLQRWIEGLGIWGPVVLGVIYVVAAILFIPGWILTVTAGALYGIVVGMITASLASTTAAAVTFLIARYVARERVRKWIQQSPKLAAVDEAIGQQGWKIVALLRLSPAVPFNLQNYLYGVTAIRFWPCVLTSWVAMLPGAFLYVYLGSLGRAAVQDDDSASTWQWVLRGVGLIATVVVTVYVARLAQRAIRERTQIEESHEDGSEST